MIFRVMAVLLLLVQVSAQCYSQNVRFPRKTATLKEALDYIQKQTGFDYIFQEGNEFRDSLVSLPTKATPLLTVLKSILDGHSLDFEIKSNTILIQKKTFSLAPEAASTQSLIIKGTVEDENGKPLPGATIQLKHSSRGGTQSDEQGGFQLNNIPADAIMVVSYTGMATVEKKAEPPYPVRIRLNGNVMGEVVVDATNGYQHLLKDSTPVSLDVIDQTFIDRSTAANVLDRIENSGPGILFTHGGQTANGTAIQDPIQVRGRSTLFANSAPLFVLDHFPYDGDLGNINPNDIESISVLKDAAASSIWGARASNGVIVIVSKKSRSTATQLVYHSSVSLEKRPDLFNIHAISSGDFLDFEKTLYDQNYYSAGLANPQNYTPFTPGVLLYDAEARGFLSPAAAEAQLADLRKQDVRNDIGKYLYRTSLDQQHSMQLSGGSGASRYNFSVGWDHDLSTLSATQYDRITLRSQNSFQVARNLQIEAGVNFAETNNRNGDNIQYNYQSPLLLRSIYPYAQLADARGHALPVNLDYSPSYLQQTRALGFPSWEFKPLNELDAETNRVKTRDYLLTAGIRYTIFHPLTLEVRYQFEDQMINGTDLHSDSSYYTRDLINSVIQVNRVTQALTYPVPQGNIFDMNDQEIVSHQGRIQLNYTRQWGIAHSLEAIGGYEVRSLETTGNTNRYYGYDPDRSAVNPTVDYTGSYAQYLTYTTRSIPNPQAISKLTDHFISYYANGSYSYRRRYSFYGSIRKDEANLFGVTTNEKGVPLWSTGLGWDIHKEEWYRSEWLPHLKLRATYGHSGNIARLASASTIAAIFPGGGSGSPYPMLYIESPPNKKLRWEQVGQLNFGIDFATQKNILTGSIEYYQKHAKDLLAPIAADPTLGLTQSPGTAGSYYGNTAAIDGKGVDLQLATHYRSHSFSWTTNVLFNYSVSKVQQYLNPVGLGNLYLNQNSIHPVQGRPVFSLYSFKTSGLNPQTGDPQGIYQGKSSADYNSIFNYTPLDSMQYSGPAQPVFFGSLRNNFSLGNFSLSFMLSYQAGHYYRQPSISYSDLAVYWRGNSDYAKRWQHPGDEQKTNVPSVSTSLDGLRDLVYLYSRPLVKKSDEVRWEDITAGYDLDKNQQKRLPFQHVRFYGTVTGLGLLWAANKGIDPYYINVPKERPRYSLGVTIHFIPLKPTR